MPSITVGSERLGTIELHYETYGEGDPVVMIHAYSLSGDAWEKQVRPLVAAGFRVVLYDRRGFGRSGRSPSGYDLDVLVWDLHSLIEELNLQRAALVGHSMGGAEVVRYLSSHGTARVQKAVYIAAVNPFLAKTPDNPLGLETEVFRTFQSALLSDRPAALAANLARFYNADLLLGTRLSSEKLRADFLLACQAAPTAVHDCVDVWLNDLREDHESVHISNLVIHGTADVSIPIEASGKRTALYPNSRLIPVKDAPHGLIWTHSDEVNTAILDFIGG